MPSRLPATPGEFIDRDLRCAVLSDAPVLISGGDRAGRAHVAHRIHDSGDRRTGPFVLFDPVNPVWEQAANGTLYVDEVAELSSRLQLDLIRRIDAGLIAVAGVRRYLRRVRVISATSSDLSERVASCRFDESLLYRLNALHIVIV